MRMPSIALPTGPYDWHPERTPKAVFDARLIGFREAMARHDVTHAIVHGNGFDHAALHWLTHFTPKLGPAYALISAASEPRLLFAGGPGMKPSAQKLTWIEDVTALRAIATDAKRWMDETARAEPMILGLVEGSSMLYGDWNMVRGLSSCLIVELDAKIERLMGKPDKLRADSEARAQQILDVANRTLQAQAASADDLHTAVIEMERAAYAEGAQDVRVKASLRPGGPPTTLSDAPMLTTGPTRVVVAIRYDGTWKSAELTLSP